MWQNMQGLNGVIVSKERKCLAATVPKASNQKSSEILLHVKIDLRKKNVPWFCNTNVIILFLSWYLCSGRRGLMLHRKCIGQENYIPHPTQITL